MKESELYLASIMSARAKIEIEPAYSTWHRGLLSILYVKLWECPLPDPSLGIQAPRLLQKVPKAGDHHPSLASDVLNYDLDNYARPCSCSAMTSYLFGTADALRPLFHPSGAAPFGNSSIFWMRIAMGLASAEKEER